MFGTCFAGVSHAPTADKAPKPSRGRRSPNRDATSQPDSVDVLVSDPAPALSPAASLESPPKSPLEPRMCVSSDTFDSPDSTSPRSSTRMSKKPSTLDNGESMGLVRPKSGRLSKYASSTRLMSLVPGKANLAFIATSDEMVRLDTVIHSEKGRQELVSKLIALPGDLVTKIRFCSAVEQYDSQVGDSQEDRDKKLMQVISLRPSGRYCSI
ncbi:hypothetical protein BASA81_004171 [Batrachochytrium salamandrivorans]|nr:hypothetical protein BASA81_004171 [Batrachochytrium salamandrivorans]